MIFFRILLCLLLTAIPAAAETRIRILGLKGQSEAQALDLLGKRLEHIRTDNPSASRADDAAFLLTQLLRKDGYSSAEVDWKLPGGDNIDLIVREGPRVSLGTVTITGANSSDTKRFARLFATPAEKDRPFGLGLPPFREDDVPKGLAFLVQDMHAQGYWQATAVESQRRQRPKTGHVDIDITVNPGPLFTIARATVSSTDGRGVKRVATTAEPYIGRTANTAQLNSLRLEVEQAFFSRGYPDAKIQMSRTLQGDQFIPHFSIDLGTRVRLRSIEIEGLQRTNKDRVMRLFKNTQGEWYDEAAMNKRTSQLLATGAFSSVRIETEEVAPKRIDATLRLKESRARELSVAAGTGSYEGFISRFTYTDRNLYGQLLGFSAGLEFTSRGVLGEARLTDPWFTGRDLAFTTRLFSLIKEHEGYSIFRTGLETSLNWTGFQHYNLELLAGLAVINTTEKGLTRQELGESVYNHTYLRLTQGFDYRDSPVIPKHGWHIKSPLEVGMAIGDDSTSYFKMGLQGGWYKQLGQKHHLSAGGQFGLMMPSGDSQDLPIDLRYFNGGARSVRSFAERELGPEGIDGDPLGGEAYWAANLQLMRDIAGPLQLIGFLDAGSLARNYDELGAADLEMAIGLGLRLELPIGPIRLEYGHSLTRDSGEPSGALHFAIGSTF